MWEFPVIQRYNLMLTVCGTLPAMGHILDFSNNCSCHMCFFWVCSLHKLHTQMTMAWALFYFPLQSNSFSFSSSESTFFPMSNSLINTSWNNTLVLHHTQLLLTKCTMFDLIRPLSSQTKFSNQDISEVLTFLTSLQGREQYLGKILRSTPSVRQRTTS